MTERLQKFLSRAGVASRRHAEELIQAGRVKVNNQTVTELGTKVEPGQDLVQVDDKLVSVSEERAYFVLYKPAGYVTTLVDPEGRPTVADLLQSAEKRVYPVGRLDYDAEGALLVTDDGDLAHRLMHPGFLIPRTYLAKVKGAPDEATLEKLRGGVRLEDGLAKPLEVAVFEKAEKNTWLKLVLGEGRTHLVKRLCAAVGHPVVRLFRPHHAGVGVEGLQPGAMRPLTTAEVEALKDVAAGKAPPKEPALRLPARRHGRAGEGEEEGAPEEAPRQRGERRAFEGRERKGGPRRDERERFTGNGGQRRPGPPGRRFGDQDRFTGGERPSRAPRKFGDRERSSAGGGERPGRPPRKFGDRERSGAGGGERPGRPPRKFGDRERFGAGGGERSGRPPRRFGDRERIAGGGGGERPERPPRKFGDRERFAGGGGGERPERPPRKFGERKRFGAGERPSGPRGESGGGGRPGGSRPGGRRFGGPPGARGGKGAPRPGGRGPPRGPRGGR